MTDETTRGRTAVRTAAAKLFVALVWATQLYFVVAAYDDPQKHFGYQPFSQSSTWEAQVVRVLHDGRRFDIREGWEGYRWPDMVRGRGLDVPWRRHHASSGIEATLERFQRALDWVAEHTPDDRTTHHFEARVRYVKNRHAPVELVMRSVTRP